MATPITYPARIPQPFCLSGTKNTIPIASASPLASFDTGFPPVNMQPISSGGIPPSGADLNGILYDITLFQAWVNGGGRFKFDATLAAAIGGYPVGIVLQLSDNVSEVICITANNTNDPNSVMTGWAPYAGLAAGIGNYVADTGTTNNIVVAVSPAVTSYKNGYWVVFKALHTNTSAMTLNMGGGANSLLRNDGAALVAGDVVSGSVYRASYDATSSAFRLESIVLSQLPPPPTPPVYFATQHDVTASRSAGTLYTNTTGKPMMLNITGNTGGAGGNLTIEVDGLTVAAFGQAATGAAGFASCLVPVGSTYKSPTGAFAITKWFETY